MIIAFKLHSPCILNFFDHLSLQPGSTGSKCRKQSHICFLLNFLKHFNCRLYLWLFGWCAVSRHLKTCQHFPPPAYGNGAKLRNLGQQISFNFQLCKFFMPKESQKPNTFLAHASSKTKDNN